MFNYNWHAKKTAEEFKVIITKKFVKAEHTGSYIRQVNRSDIQTVKTITTDEGRMKWIFGWH
jgi:hypothetical protein